MQIGSTDDPGTCPRCWRVSFVFIGLLPCILHHTEAYCRTRRCSFCMLQATEHVARQLMLLEQTRVAARTKDGGPKA